VQEKRLEREKKRKWRRKKDKKEKDCHPPLVWASKKLDIPAR